MKMIKPAFLGTLMVPAFMFAASANAQSNDLDATYMTAAPQGTFHADSLTGNSVHSTVEDDDEIGTINDLIIDQDGQIQAVVVGVGGFLGMGEKDVAIEWDSLDLTREDDGEDYVIRVNATQEALEEAEEYDRDANRNDDMNNDGMNNDTNTNGDMDRDTDTDNDLDT
ncbi:PRC-barrel domain-containing protein [Vreelandella sp. EE27]